MARDTARCAFCGKRAAAEDAHTAKAHRLDCPKRVAMERKASTPNASTVALVRSLCKFMTPTAAADFRARLAETTNQRMNR